MGSAGSGAHVRVTRGGRGGRVGGKFFFVCFRATWAGRGGRVVGAVGIIIFFLCSCNGGWTRLVVWGATISQSPLYRDFVTGNILGH